MSLDEDQEWERQWWGQTLPHNLEKKEHETTK